MQQVKCAYLFVPLLLCILITITKAEPQGVSILAKFGSPATLPCFGYGENLDLTYIDWETDSHCVFSYDEGAGDFGTKFDQRANIPKPQLRKGNFSLTIRSTKFSDAGHKKQHVLKYGEDLWISLYTQDPVTVILNNSAVCNVEGNRVINPGPRFEGRLFVVDGRLKIQAVTSLDKGRYEVRDHQENVINSVIVTVRREDIPQDPTNPVYIGAAVSCVIFVLFVFFFLHKVFYNNKSTDQWLLRQAVTSCPYGIVQSSDTELGAS